MDTRIDPNPIRGTNFDWWGPGSVRFFQATSHLISYQEREWDNDREIEFRGSPRLEQLSRYVDKRRIRPYEPIDIPASMAVRLFLDRAFDRRHFVAATEHEDEKGSMVCVQRGIRATFEGEGQTEYVLCVRPDDAAIPNNPFFTATATAQETTPQEATA